VLALHYEIEPQLLVSVSLDLRVLVVPQLDENPECRVRVIPTRKAKLGIPVVLAPGRCGGFVASVCFPDWNSKPNNDKGGAGRPKHLSILKRSNIPAYLSEGCCLLASSKASVFGSFATKPLKSPLILENAARARMLSDKLPGLLQLVLFQKCYSLL